MRVGRMMSMDVVTAPAVATCDDAVTLMLRHDIRHLPVVCPDGTLAGIVTDRDLRRLPPEIVSSVRLWEVMSTPVVTIAPGTELEDAARLMLEDKLGSLPVVEDRRVVGIITETDLLRRIVGACACPSQVRTLVPVS